MNPVYRAAGELASGGALMGVVTLAFFAFFTIVLLRLMNPARQSIYTEAALLPLDERQDEV